MGFTLTSPAFERGGMIPKRYTCDDIDVSPPLKWEGAPEGTKSFAVISDDPDAPSGGWVHWVIFNIPGHYRALNEGIEPEEKFDYGAAQGVNDFGSIGYQGPCPPGSTHRYFFTIYALNTILDLDPGCTKAELIRAMEGYVLAEINLMGKYVRQR